MAVPVGGSRIQPGEDEEDDGGGCLRSAGGAFRRPSRGGWRASRNPEDPVSTPSPEAEIERRNNIRFTKGDFSATC
jgi:hypothetical protein